MLQTTKVYTGKNAMSLQISRTLRSKILGQVCLGFSLHDHIFYFMRDVKMQSIVHLYFIFSFHPVALVLHGFALLML